MAPLFTGVCVLAAACGAAATPVYEGFPAPGAIWKDTRGFPIRAHQPHLTQLDGIYYWYGASQVGNSSGARSQINLYTSIDMYNWELKGAVYTSPTGFAARPSMLGQNPTTGKFVLWTKAGGDKSFQVAEADTPEGPFRHVTDLTAPGGMDAGGQQAFRDPTQDTAFVFYSQKKPRELKVAQLMPDWLAVGPVVSTISVNWVEAGANPATKFKVEYEAPAPFYSELTKKFYVLCSHLSGWNPNPAELFVADRLAGPWQSLGNPTGDSRSFDTQVSHVMPMGMGPDNSERFVYMSDRWQPYVYGTEGSRYVFLPLEIRGSSLQAVKPHSHLVSRGPVIPGQKDGSVVVKDPQDGWTLAAWPGDDVAGEGVVVKPPPLLDAQGDQGELAA